MNTDPKTCDTTALAYIGDAVYEVMIRLYVLEDVRVKTEQVNWRAVGFVKADSQALAARAMLKEGFLTEEETALLKRARNRTNTSRPRGSTPQAYRLATGFEAVCGWLYLTGARERLREFTDFAVRTIENAEDAASRGAAGGRAGAKEEQEEKR